MTWGRTQVACARYQMLAAHTSRTGLQELHPGPREPRAHTWTTVAGAEVQAEEEGRWMKGDEGRLWKALNAKLKKPRHWPPGSLMKTEREKWVKNKRPREQKMTEPWLTWEVLRERSFYLRKIGFICQQLAPTSSSGHLQNSHTVQVWGEKSQDQCQWERRFNIWNPIRKTIFVSLRVSWGQIGSSL